MLLPQKTLKAWTKNWGAHRVRRRANAGWVTRLWLRRRKTLFPLLQPSGTFLCGKWNQQKKTKLDELLQGLLLVFFRPQGLLLALLQGPCSLFWHLICLVAFSPLLFEQLTFHPSLLSSNPPIHHFFLLSLHIPRRIPFFLHSLPRSSTHLILWSSITPPSSPPSPAPSSYSNKEKPKTTEILKSNVFVFG